MKIEISQKIDKDYYTEFYKEFLKCKGNLNFKRLSLVMLLAAIIYAGGFNGFASKGYKYKI